MKKKLASKKRKSFLKVRAWDTDHEFSCSACLVFSARIALSWSVSSLLMAFFLSVLLGSCLGGTALTFPDLLDLASEQDVVQP